MNEVFAQTSLEKMSCDGLREAVIQEYGRVASCPRGRFSFPVGREFAESIGYPKELLDEMSEPVVESFAGVSKPVFFAGLKSGESVLDLGSGAGLDSLIAARMVGEEGHVIGIDGAAKMIEKARSNSQKLKLSNVEFIQAYAEQILLPDESVDVVISNGIFNLATSKEKIFLEIFRVLKPGGRIALSEIVLKEEIAQKKAATLQDWFS